MIHKSVWFIICVYLYAPLDHETIEQLKSATSIEPIKHHVDAMIRSANQQLHKQGTNREIEQIYQLLFELDQRFDTQWVDDLAFRTKNKGNLHIRMTNLRVGLIKKKPIPELEGLMQFVTQEVELLTKQEQSYIRREVNFIFAQCEEYILNFNRNHNDEQDKVAKINIRLQELIDMYKNTNEDKQLVRKQIDPELKQIIISINKIILCSGTSKEIEIAYGMIFRLSQVPLNDRVEDLVDNPAKFIAFPSRAINFEFSAFLYALRHSIAREQYDGIECLVKMTTDAFRRLSPQDNQLLFKETLLY